ncbi:MAG: cell division protein FtsZ [Clostridia bacterium]|nr:cell division protein FtsZ [Clostridia bacterium]
MIDFEKFGYVPQNNKPEEEEVVEQPALFEEEPAEEAEEPAPQVEEVKAPAQEEPEEYYPPVSQKKPGQANIVVVGVGGGGNNAINNMIKANIKSAQFVVMNTDMQALNMSLVPTQCKIQLGASMTGGLGAGSDPEIGRRAAEESRDRIKAALKGIDLLFITAGMGGGTGTGAAPVIAEIAKGLGILTVAVVTKPFEIEGKRRMQNAEEGIKNLKNFVDTLLVIPNQKLIEVLDKDIPLKKAFEIADDVLRQGVQGVSDVIANPELINLDFADVRTILSNKGLAHMGIGYGKGEKRVLEAVRRAVFSPLLETDIEGATGIIVNIVGGDDMKLGEVNEACDIIKSVIDPSANIILGTAIVPDKQEIEITIIATGFVDRASAPARVIGSIPTPQSHSIASALTEDPAEKAEEVAPQPEQPARPTYTTEEIFASRPTFGRPAPQPQPAQQPIAHQPQPQPAQPEQRPEPQNQVRSTVMNGKGKQVPAFLRRLRGDDNN